MPPLDHQPALDTSYLPRLHLCEFHDSDWVPTTFRHAITEILYVLGQQLRISDVVLPILENVVKQTAAERIVDLCSGAGGPVLALHEQLAARGTLVPIVLTDRFPNFAAFHLAERISDGFVRGHPEPVDATRIPPELKGARTLFNAFHHFPPVLARAILADAFHARQPIAIFETTERSLLNTLSNFPLSFLTMLGLMPRMRAKRWEWWLFTYLIPLLPTAFGWDAFVSCLRSYTASEFRELTQGLHDDSYRWVSGRIPVPRSPIHVTYHLGLPQPR